MKIKFQMELSLNTIEHISHSCSVFGTNSKQDDRARGITDMILTVLCRVLVSQVLVNFRHYLHISQSTFNSEM